MSATSSVHTSRQDLWRRLTDAGLVTGELPAAGPTPAPWYVRLMLGVAGWLGAMFLLGFAGVGMSFVFDNEAAALVVGGLCCAGAWALFRSYGHNDLAAQFGLAVSLAGQALFIMGLHESVIGRGPVFYLLVAAFEAGLAFVIANFVHRVACTIAGAIAFGLAFTDMGLYGFGPAALAVGVALLWLAEPQWAARGALWRPVGYGLVLALLLPETSAYGVLFSAERDLEVLFRGIVWVKPVVIACLLVYVTYRLLAADGTASSRAESAALAAAGIIALVTLRATGVATSLIILLLGFAGGNRALMGLGVVAMLGYLSYFYYSLQATLLAKSMALAMTGLVLIGLWAAMRYLFGDDKEAVRA